MVKSYISELLPRKYRKRHQLMLYLYDILVDILVKADKYQLSSLSFEFTNKIDDKIDLFDELERQRDIEISERVLIPHIFFSILRDLNYYLFESLSCIERGSVNKKRHIKETDKQIYAELDFYCQSSHISFNPSTLMAIN